MIIQLHRKYVYTFDTYYFYYNYTYYYYTYHFVIT